MKAIEFARFGTQVVSLISVAFACGFAVPAFAQGLPVDWSHRHVIASNPETREEAEAKGTLDKWVERANDPRFVLQLERRESALAAKANKAAGGNPLLDTNFGATTKQAAAKPEKPEKEKKPTPASAPQMHRDWSNVMGGAAGVGGPLVYPAKYAFGISAKDCANDFVVFTTSSEGADSSGTFLTSVAIFSGRPVRGETFEIHNKRFAPDQILTLTAHASMNTGLNFAVGSNGTQAATNLANAIARNGGTVGVTATANGDVTLTITSITADVRGRDINFPNNLSNFQLDRDVRGRGTPGQPTIFALNQLYADTVANGGCQTPTQAVPATYWSYNTSGTTYTGFASTTDFGPSGTTRYGPLSGACTALANSTRVVPTDPPAPCDTIATRGIVRGFSATTGIPPSQTTITFTVMKNGAPTSITCSNSTSTSCADTVHQEIFADGDVISVRIARTGTGTGIWNTSVALILDPPPVIAQTSPVLSLGGEQVAFVQNTSGGVVGTDVASLVLLRWTAELPSVTIGVPRRPNLVNAATYHSGCILPCMMMIPLNGAAGDSNSSPYVDYAGDVLYVGDDSGKLHKFTGVFNGTPAEEVAGGFPAIVSDGNVLSSPVYDSATGLVFVGSGGEAVVNTNGNRLHSVGSLSGIVRDSVGIGTSSLRTGVRDAPIVDSTAKRVYAFIGADQVNPDSLGLNCSPAPTCATVVQLRTDVRLDDQDPAKVIVGASSDVNDTNHYIYSGQFDDTYWSSADPANPSGYLYVCGSLLELDLHPSLWKIQIANNAFVDRTRGPQLVAENLLGTPNGCSPVTIVKNGSTERLFVGVSENAGAFGGGGCTTGSCVYSYDLPFATASSVISFPTTIGDNTARYMSISVPDTLSTVETERESLVEPVNEGTFNGMIITQSGPLPSGTRFTYTLRKNGSNTTVTCQVVTTSCSDTTHSISNVAGEKIDLQVQRTAGTGPLRNRTIRVQLGSAAAAAIDAPGGTGGIIIDNTVSGGGSQIYYSTRATGTAGTPKGIAVQASQDGLN